MSLFGKVLAVLNVFGMLGLVVLALMVYTKRQAWEYANYRFDLAENGLPLHKEETDPEGNLKYQDVSKQTQQDLFPTEPVATQKEEVERVQKLLKGKLDAESDSATQSALCATFLLPLARTNAQRERLVSIRRHLEDAKTVDQLKTDLLAAYVAAVAINKADPKKQVEWAFADRLTINGGEPRRPFEKKFADIMRKERTKAPAAAFTETLEAINADLKAELDRQFKQVLEGNYLFLDDQGAFTIKKMTTDERQDATSYLLFNLVEAEVGEPAADTKDKPQLYQAPAYKRYLNVVGLAAANRTLNQQVSTLSRILSDLAYAQDHDRSGFATTLMPVLDQSRDAARNVDKLTADLTGLTAKVNAQDVLVKARQKDVAEATAELTKHRKTTAEKLGLLGDLSKAVFALRVEVRDKTVTNQENERKIRELEGWRWLPFVGGQFLINRAAP